MKFSASLLAALAPVALAKSVRNHYPRGSKRTAPGLSLQNGLAGFGITESSLTEVIIIWVNPGAGSETTTINQQVTVTETVTAGGEMTTTMAEGATAVVGAAATHTVTVGGPAGLSYTPDNIQAAVGDMVIFEFLSQNHTVTQSAFDTPCLALDGGMDTGFQPNPNNTISPAPQVAMQVMESKPLWFYCRQKNHCGKGMTFSINPTADKTQALFQSMAIAQNGTGAGSALTGGEGAPADAGNAASSSAAEGESTTLAQLPGATEAASATEPAGEVATATDSIVQGTGTVLPDGACSCAVVVGAGAFPAVEAQGIGNFGGMAGSLPMEMAEA